MYVEKYMMEALEEAKLAFKEGEIPIGCIIEQNGEIIGRGHNQTEGLHDTTAHAEILAIRMASKYLGDTLGWRRLTGCNMYVTMEPCSMCAGASVWSRIETIYVGTLDPKAGGCGSVLDITGEPKLNHKVNVELIEDGPVKETCQKIVQDFFRNLRQQEKERKTRRTENEET